MPDTVRGMILALSIVSVLVVFGIVGIVHLLGKRFTEMHQAVLQHLASTQVIGGQPVDLAREQFQAQFQLKSEEAKTQREAMVASIARQRMPTNVVD